MGKFASSTPPPSPFSLFPPAILSLQDDDAGQDEATATTAQTHPRGMPVFTQEMEKRAEAARERRESRRHRMNTNITERNDAAAAASSAPPPPVNSDDDTDDDIVRRPRKRRRQETPPRERTGKFIPWPPARIRAFAQEMQTGSTVKVTFALDETANNEVWIGKVTQALAQNSDGYARVDFGPHGEHNFPLSRAKGIEDVQIIAGHVYGDLPPFSKATEAVRTEPFQTIFTDGGTVMKTGASAAAIAIFDKATIAAPIATHGVFSPASTNNICEYAAFVAALNHIKTQPPPSPLKTLVIVDSELVYKHMTNVAACNTHHLRPLNAAARKLFDELMQKQLLILAHMYRSFNNRADEVVQKVRAQTSDIGDAKLFPPLPLMPSKTIRHAAPPLAFSSTSADCIAQHVKSEADFIRMKRFTTRSRCPEGAVPVWASIVKSSLQRIVDAPTSSEREKAVITFLLLPTSFLPVAAPQTRVENHLQSGRPFNLTQRQCRPEQPEGDAATAAAAALPAAKLRKSQEQRLKETVERLALDRKIKSAVKLLQQDAMRPDAPFEEKVEVMHSKFIRRTADFGKLDATPTDPFSAAVVWQVLKKMSRNAATCIDGWTKDLLKQAMCVDSTIAEDIGYVCALVNNGSLSPLAMNIIRMGRLVAVPKPDGGARPIVISSFLAKLTGACVMQTAKMKCSHHQYAVSSHRGAERIIHLARHDYEAGRAIIRLDSSNAFNVAPRAKIAEILRTAPDEMRNYFNAIYEPSATLILYGPDDKHSAICSEEGVRQGDAASALLFCKLMDIACCKITNAIPEADVWCYMDDLTISCPVEKAIHATAVAIQELGDLGFKINVNKSAITSTMRGALQHLRQEARATNMSIQVPPLEVPFKMLGAVLNDAYSEFSDEKMKATTAFLEKVCAYDLHPQLIWTILRLCGTPKYIYLGSTTPPNRAAPILRHFDVMLKVTAEKVIQAPISAEYLYHRLGAGFPCYERNAEALYNASKTMALTRDPKGVGVELVLDDLPHTADLRSQFHAPFLFFSRATRYNELTHTQFRIAMCIHLRTLPQMVNKAVPTRCNCGVNVTTNEMLIEHSLKCDKFGRYTRTHRHNIVRDAIAAIARSYGITATLEPRFYSYESGNCRPDITFHTLPRAIATDVSIVYPDTDPGIAANRAAKAKEEIHKKAVERLEHTFIPFIMETFGYAHESCAKLAKALMVDLPKHRHTSFRFDMEHAASNALAIARANTVLSAIGSTPVEPFRQLNGIAPRFDHE